MFRNFFTWKKDEPSNLGDEIIYADSITKEVVLDSNTNTLEIILRPQNNTNFLSSFKTNSTTYSLRYSETFAYTNLLNTFKNITDTSKEVHLIVEKLTVAQSMRDNDYISCSYVENGIENLTISYKLTYTQESFTQTRFIERMHIVDLFQIVNTNTTSITPIDDVNNTGAIPYVHTSGSYNKAVLTNAVCIADNCTTNIVARGDLSSLYKANATAILPQTFTKYIYPSNQSFKVSSINAAVNTGVKDSNNKDIIIGINNVNIENNANDSYINLVNEDISQNILERDWNNFYVNQITMLKSQKDLLDTVPENEEHPEDGPWKMIGYRGTEGIQANVRDGSLILINEMLVTDVELSSETDYVAIQLDFADQYKSGFLDSEIENGVLTLYLNRDCSTKFRSMMDSYTNILLYVNRMEFTENIYFYINILTSIHVYYYDGSSLNSKYVSEPKVYSNFKTKIENLYYAAVNSINYLLPQSYFNENKTIQVGDTYCNFIDIISNSYYTGNKISRNGTTIKSQKINLFMDGEIPIWVFKEVLPLQEEVVEEGQTKIYKKYIDSRGNVYRATEPRNIDDLEIIGINADPGMKNIRFPSKEQEIWTDPIKEYQGSSINLSDIEKGAVANLDTFKRMYVKEGENKLKKVFYVNEVKLLKRFQEKLPITEGTFTYFEYESDVNKEKNSTITWSEEHDWSLDLPDCYEGCEIDENDTTLLVMKFGTYEQLNLDAYLLKDVVRENDLYLDVSISEINVSNISKINLILEEMKYFISEEGESEEKFGFFANKQSLNVIYIIFNDNGFVGTKSLNYEDLTDSNFRDEIKKCYIIGGNNELKNSIRMVEPFKNVFMIYNDRKCIALKYNINYEYNLSTGIDYRITNAFNDHYFYGINLLVAGEIPTWVLEYMPLPIKLNYVTYDSNYGWIFELSKDKTNMTHRIISVNALPTPDGDVGIDNSDPDDQCILNLEEFINPPKP